MHPPPAPSPEDLARLAVRAVALVREAGPTVCVGLGSGRAAEAFVRALAAERRLEVLGVPTSRATAALATSVGVVVSDRVVDPRFRNGRLALRSGSPAVDRVKKATMKRDLRGRRVGVDGNGDGKRGSDIGALEAKNPKRRH